MTEKREGNNEEKIVILLLTGKIIWNDATKNVTNYKITKLIKKIVIVNT